MVGISLACPDPQPFDWEILKEKITTTDDKVPLYIA